MEKASKAYGTLNVEKKPTWLDEANIDILQKSKFNKLLSFYVIHTPDSKKSVRGKSIQEYHFEHNELINFIKSNIKYWESSGNGYVVQSRFIKAELEPFPPEIDFTERVCFSYKKKEELTYFFGHIRNSLAHGRFNITGSKKDPVIILEDINNQDNCSARMVLRLSTMIQWIEFFEKRS